MAIDLTLETSTIAWGNRTNTTINRPANTADGDFLFCGIFIWANYAITPPSGWTSIARVDNPQGGHVEIFYKRASSEGASWTWTHTNTSTVGFVQRITGVVAAGNPEEGTRTTDTTESWNNDPISCGSITTSTNGAALLMFYGGEDTTSWGSTTLTERLDLAVAGFASATQATAGASGTKSATPSGPGTVASGVMIAITPAASGGGASSTPSFQYYFNNARP